MSVALPVTIIGGFLGSGKTTLVNHLLRQANGVRIAVLVNDFGDLPIDADLIEGQDGDVINLSGGCICCSYGDDLSLSLQKLQAQPELPDHIFIEASGVALPGAIGKSLSLLRRFQLEGIVVLADASTIQAASAQKYIGDTVQRQLGDADLIVLNKLDLLSDTQIQAVQLWMDENYALAPRIRAVHSTIDPQVLFAIKQKNETNISEAKFDDVSANAENADITNADAAGANTMSNKTASAHAAAVHEDISVVDSGQPAQSAHEHNVSSIFSTLQLSVDNMVDANALAAQLASKQCALVRAKGFVLDTDHCLKTIQVVGRRWSVTPAPENVQTGLVCIAQARELSESNIRSLCKLDAQVVV